MQEFMNKELLILTSHCDNTSHLSIPTIFSLFQDLASEHGTRMKVGFEQLSEKGLFWLTARTKIHIENRPSMMDLVTLKTWPEKPGRVRCNRYYQIFLGDQLLITGKTEWAVIHLESGRLQKLTEVYPEDMEHCPDIALEEPYTKIPEDFTDCQILGTYKVRSTDIDMGQHMNNAAYPRVIFGSFSCQQIADMNIHDAEIAFRSPCFEGEELTLYQRPAENGALDIGLFHSDGRIAAACRLS